MAKKNQRRGIVVIEDEDEKPVREVKPAQRQQPVGKARAKKKPNTKR